MVIFDPAEEAQLEAVRRQNEQRIAAASAATVDQAALLTQWRQMYPHVDPSIVLPMAQAGIDPNSEVARAVGQAEVKRKKKRGLGLHSIGDLVKATGGGLKATGSALLPDFVGETLHSGAVKTTIRGATAGLDQFPQTIQGTARNLFGDGIQGNDFNPLHVLDQAGDAWLHQSDLGVATGHLVKGEGFDAGSGFFVGGQIKKEATANRRAAAPLIDGHAWSIGRRAAAAVVSPGTKPYNVLSGLVDGAVLLGGDPSTYVGGGVRNLTTKSTNLARPASKRFAEQAAADASKTIKVRDPDKVAQAAIDISTLPARDATDLRTQAGLVRGVTRDTVLPDRAAEWLLSKAGQRVVNHLTDTTSYTELRKMFKGKIDEQTLVQLADARSTQEVYDILGPQLGTNLGVAPLAAGRVSGAVAAGLDKVGIGNGLNASSALPMTVTRPFTNVRLAAMLPGRSVDLRDANDSVEQLDRFLRNAKIKPALRDHYLEQMARAGNRNGRFQVMRNTMDATIDHLREEFNLGPGTRKLTEMWKDYDKRFAIYAMDEIGENLRVPGAVIDGTGKALPTPHLHAEFLNRAVPLPDARDIRRAASRYRGVFQVPGVSPGIAALDGVTQQMFKPLVLLRGAWTVRVVGEEQLRMAASGLNSAFLHPLSHLAMAVSAGSKTGQRLSRLGVEVGRGGTDLRGAHMLESQEALDALSRGSNSFRDATRGTQKREAGMRQRKLLQTNAKTIVNRGEDNYARAWMDELADLHHDPLASRIALGSLRTGDGNFGKLSGLDLIKEWWWRGEGSKIRLDMAESNGHLLGRQGSDAWVDSMVERVAHKTKGDLDLMDLVAHGRHKGEPVFTLTGAATRQQGKADRKLLDDLQARARDETYDAPKAVRGDVKLSAVDGGKGEFTERYDAVVENLFNTLMSKPTNFLSRGPAFKQYYWNKAIDLAQHMTPEAQRAALAAARTAKLGKDDIAKLREAIERGSGKLSIEDADHLAKGHGLDSTRKLLYDLHDRSQFFDVNRLLFPFGEAWKEVLTTWAKLGVENPILARRASQIITGGRDADLNGDGQGFFYPDPNTGQEMFAFPLSQYFSQVVAGVPAPMSAPVAQLNILGQSVLPGFGPVVQIAAGHLLPDDPSYDGLRKIIIPYGENDTSGGLFESLFPAWFKKVQASGELDFLPLFGRSGERQERQYANLTKDVASYLMSTGKYDASSPEGQQHLIEDAKKKASRLMLLRGLAQNVAPSPPLQEIKAKDKDGNLTYVYVMANEYRKLREEDYRTATQKFIAKFGEDAFLTTISKTTGDGPVSGAAFNLERKHPDVARAFPDIFAYFAKADPNAKFDQAAYQRQLDTGQRQTRPLPDALVLANQRIASSIYRQAKEQVGERPDAAGRDWLRKLQAALVEDYQGYSPVPNNLADTPKLIQQTVEASRNPVLAKTDAGQALSVYVAGRQKALDAARSMDLSGFSTSDKAKGIRDWLRQLGEALVKEHPDFAGLYDEVLTRELGDE